MPRFSHVPIIVTNDRGETGPRRIVPVQIEFAARKFHPEPQWLLNALDLDESAYRTFALSGLKAWGAPAVARLQLHDSGLQLATELLNAITNARELLGQVPRLERRAMAAFEILADAEASAKPENPLT